MVTQGFDITVIGHFSNDCLRLPSSTKSYSIMGGAVAYVSMVARRLGSSVSVISKVGGDFPDAYLQTLMNEGVHTSNIIKVNNEQTTSFELTYSSDLSTRTLRLQQQSSPITVADLPKSLHSKAFHIAPIAGEISYDVVKRLKNYGACISIDPQGMTRRFDTNGNVTCSVQIDKHVLNLIDIYRSSLEEAVTLTGQSDLNSIIKTLHELGPKIVIITIGEKGSVLSTSGSIFKVPIYTSANVVDPTGAGDAFIGALLTEYVAGKNLLWCACVGSAAASIVVENIGSTSFGEKTEIYRRASSIYNKT
jgi:sugar/nucleoside kinase (ribokinase family)